MPAGSSKTAQRPPSRKGKAHSRGHVADSAAAPRRYNNRDESWLLFNRRVLEEADDASNPLLERLKFLSITSSNLDEFLEIRVAGELQRIEEDEGLPSVNDEGGLTQDQRWARLREMLHSFAHDQTACWNERLAPELAKANIRVVRWKQLKEAEREFANRFFIEQIDPLLTPVTIDPSHPFPRVLNKALCVALLLRPKRRSSGSSKARALGVITVPRSLPTLLVLPGKHGHHHVLLLDELIEAQSDRMFRGYAVLSRATFRVTRNSNLYMQEEEARSVLESVREELHNRRKGDAVRLEIDADADDEITERLRLNFELDPWQVFRTEAPVNLSRLMDLYSALKLPDLKFPEFHGRRLKLASKSTDIFAELRQRDILLHHPFDSYSAVEGFVKSATEDPAVVSIKQTLYRTSDDSAIFRALTDAAQTKDVTVVIELMARFDEASNIRWARELEDAGVQVYHGLFGLKTHCKLVLLTRRDPDGALRSYAHLGTGNYNSTTARFYTDVSLLTSRPELTSAVARVFRMLTADWTASEDTYRPLQVAPVTLATDVLRLIGREADHARERAANSSKKTSRRASQRAARIAPGTAHGEQDASAGPFVATASKPAHIIAKMNALLDEKTIEALYAASQAGVEVDLIVRGMCALRPGVPGMSENIRVRSIVGRFLEHSRVFWFANNGAPELYAGSADWMSRNLYERCEVVFPVTDPAAFTRLRDEILEAYLKDDLKARLQQPDGSYIRAPRSGEGFSAQAWLMQQSAR